MTEAEIQNQLLKQLTALPLSAQQQVLYYAQSLATTQPPATSAKGILSLFGCMTHEEAEEMRQIIEEEFERIDPDEW